MKSKLFKYLYLVIVVVISIYSVKNLSIVVSALNSDKSKQEHLEHLQQRFENMDDEVKNLTVKIHGLQEETLDKDLLEYQAKTLLNMVKSGEIIVIE